MEYITKFLPFEQIMTKNHANKIEILGYANVYDLPDLVKDVVKKNAFAESLQEHSQKGTMPQMLFEHKRNFVCGKWTNIEEDLYGLRILGEVEVGDVVQKVKKGYITGLSIGFSIAESYHKDGLRYIAKGILHEVSLVGTPANTYSRFVTTNTAVAHSVSNRMYG